MTATPSDATAAALVEFLQGRHREFARQVEELDDEGTNWRPGQDTNSIYEILLHALGAERSFISTLAGTPVRSDPAYGLQGTATQALDRLQQADADLVTYLAAAQIDVGQDIQFYRRTMSVALALALGLGHVNEHLGQVQLTRQLWDQFGKTGVLPGWQRETAQAG